MASVAIITARGGSKRIPRKNIKDFLGKPIIAYSIEAAIQSELFDEVMVSTDDEEIAEISRQYGAKIPFMRSEKNADDYAGTAEVLLEVIQEYEERGIYFDEACCLYPTAPFVTSQKLKESYKAFHIGQYDTLFPVVAFSYPIQRALRIGKDKKVSMFYPENLRKRSQDFEPAYHDAGQFYWFKPGIIKEYHSLWTENSGALKYFELEVQDIDTIQDWKLAELKYRYTKL
jgi:N-acylneuraminate cytidylyltransferase